MRTTPHLGLTVWDSNNDTFDSTQLAANWDAIDADYTRTRPANQVQVVTTVASVPSPVEGTLAYLSAADSGFTAGTLIRYSSATWKAVPGVEVQAAVPSSGNYAGRMVLLSASSGSFAAWSLIRYDGAAWALANYTYELQATVPSSGNFAGRLVMLTTANGGYNAFDLIRYDGAAWAKVGPQAIPPATELVSFAGTADISTTNTVSPGDTITTFSAATFENVKYYFDVSIPWCSHSIASGNARILLRESGTTIVQTDLPTSPTANAGHSFNVKLPFTPTAGSHTYLVTYMTLTAGTFSIAGASHGNYSLRIIKA